ncbi:hypothetical protein OE88DRAFT_1182710 [Heliocybe sulcata]|uniref:Uncharacterized protein n=1 Tax=Heliocybe sulcata TaxID=5364 RepID=A0A5C3NL03_9AGAM|nr:hypothetical protein OE88DRAFT_1182710 [Heliocybe sulcata]
MPVWSKLGCVHFHLLGVKYWNSLRFKLDGKSIQKELRPCQTRVRTSLRGTSVCMDNHDRSGEKTLFGPLPGRRISLVCCLTRPPWRVARYVYDMTATDGGRYIPGGPGRTGTTRVLRVLGNTRDLYPSAHRPSVLSLKLLCKDWPGPIRQLLG